MPVSLIKPNDCNPDETHRYDLDDWLKFVDSNGAIQTGRVFDRGYTETTNRPVYAVSCEDNMERTVMEVNTTLLD